MKKISYFLFFIFLFSLKVNAQEKVYFNYFEVYNMNKDYQLSTSNLLKLYVDAKNKMTIVLAKKDTMKYSKEQICEQAKALNINHVLIGEMNRVGEIVVVSVNMYNSTTGQKEWYSIQKASSPDDLDPIMQLISTLLSDNKTMGDSEDIYNVTEYNSKQLNRISSNNYWGLEIGGGVLSMGSGNKLSSGFSLIYAGDLRDLLFDIKGSLSFGDLNMQTMLININYPLKNKKATPYVGAGLGLCHMDYYEGLENLEGSGLNLYANAGYIFNRNSSMNLRINASLFLSTFNIKDSNPFGILVGLGVLF